jgi:hypothetical protein
MDDERQVRPGFLPPKAPDAAAPPRFQAPGPPRPSAPAERPTFVAHRTESGPSSALAVTGTAIGAVSILLLLASFGVGYPYSLMFSTIALGCGLLARKQIAERGDGRAGQARAALWVAGIGLVLALIAMVVWLSLQASGYTPEDFLDWMRERLERLEEQQNERRGRSTPSDDVQS